MTDERRQGLFYRVSGKLVEPVPVGFIIDSLWPGSA